jgi:hypothetical protein
MECRVNAPENPKMVGAPYNSDFKGNRSLFSAIRINPRYEAAQLWVESKCQKEDYKQSPVGYI